MSNKEIEVECASCGDRVLQEEINECPQCLEKVCNQCFNKDLDICYDCLDDLYLEEPNLKGLGKFHADE